MILRVKSREQFTIINEGTYEAKLDSIEPIVTVHGDACKFVFTITDYDSYSSRRVSGMCGSQLCPESKLYKWLSAIVCREFTTDEEVDLEQFIGMICLVTVAHTERGGRTYANVVDVISDDTPF